MYVLFLKGCTIPQGSIAGYLEDAERYFFKKCIAERKDGATYFVVNVFTGAVCSYDQLEEVKLPWRCTAKAVCTDPC